MAEKVYQVRDVGIYHGLPVYPESLRGLTAIVTGANGISGNYMMRVLAQAPHRWNHIYCLSRRPPAIPGGLPKNATHIPLDFLKRPEEIAEVLKKEGVKADYVFFFSYIQVEPKAGVALWSNAEEMCRVNTLLLSNFLSALPLASIKPKRVMLQTGAKNYGLHLGPTVVPQEEHDPRVLLEPNFYYPQEDYLWSYCQKHNVGWNVARPSFILGAVPDAAMNVAFPIAAYASVCKYLNAKLEFPGSLESWETVQVQSSAMMNGYLEEWMVLNEGANNQAFNASDDSAFCYGKFWPKLASWYGLECVPPNPDEPHQEVMTPHEPPPRGFGPAVKLRYKFTLAEWAQRPEIAKAWKELAEKHGLVDKEFRDPVRVFTFADAALSWSQQIYFSVDKARSMGWQGHVNSSESFLDVFHDLAGLKMIPPVPVPRP